MIKDFGNEWSTYNQSSLKNSETEKLFNNYFQIFLLIKLTKFSLIWGGSGRWANFIAPKVKIGIVLNLATGIKCCKIESKNCKFFKNEVTNCPLKDNYKFWILSWCLHHIPDT